MNTYAPKYRWTAHSDDGCYNESSCLFDTQEKCYENMMNVAIDKMKWNLEWSDVLSDGATKTESKGLVTTGEPIGYELKVNADEIVHKSYSGIYTYKIEVVQKEWKPRFKVNDIINVCNGNTVALVVCANECATDPNDFGYKIVIYGQEVPKYNEWKKDKDHWISADDESNWRKIGEVTMDVENGDV